MSSTVRDSAITSYDAHDRGIHVKSLRTARYKLVVFAGETYGELFDLEKDPNENHNCFFDPDYQTVRSQLFELFTHRLIQDQDPLPERKALW
jgi:arylsulfatase A-like enzyme